MSVYRNSSETENSRFNLQTDRQTERKGERQREKEKERRNIPAESPKVKHGSNCIIFQTKRTNREREVVAVREAGARSSPNYVQV